MPKVGSSYQPLADYLAVQTADVVRLSFAEIETILRRELPTSVYLRL